MLDLIVYVNRNLIEAWQIIIYMIKTANNNNSERLESVKENNENDNTYAKKKKKRYILKRKQCHRNIHENDILIVAAKAADKNSHKENINTNEAIDEEMKTSKKMAMYMQM